MDLQKLRRGAVTGTSSLIELPEYIITTFIPGAQPLLAKYPRIFRFVGVLLALWYLGPLARLQTFWNRFSALLIATVTVSSEEDLFSYLSSYLSERKTLRADQTLNAISNAPQESRRHRRDPDYEESNRRSNEEPKIKYEQSQGIEIFLHKKRIFWVSRKYGEGHTYTGNRYKRIENLSLSCLGRSTQPIKDLIEDIYYMHKDKERSLTIIRRPYANGYGSKLSWSRLTAKPRRDLDTVILDGEQKAQVLADVEEYMDDATSTFYGNHGIPYRRGYLFHGPPGVGKTSFALALASKFNLDVYVLSLLDQNLTDSDLIALLNQLPGRSLLLLEDIDTAGLNRKHKAAIVARASRRRKPKNKPEGAIAKTSETDLLEDSEEEGDEPRSRVSLSGLLNAIDGVAAPEGHILIMTTNKPHELDDALVRAGRISVRVGFKHASKSQAEEIFLRMYFDIQQTNSVMSSNNGTSPTNNSEKPPSNTDNTPTKDELSQLAKQFASFLPDFDFSPADLQDYLLMHKKHPVEAVKGLQSWMDEIYEERKKKDEEKEAEREIKHEKKLAERRRFREDIKAAVKEGEEERDIDQDKFEDGDTLKDSRDAKEGDKNEHTSDSVIVGDSNPSVLGATKAGIEDSTEKAEDDKANLAKGATRASNLQSEIHTEGKEDAKAD